MLAMQKKSVFFCKKLKLPKIFFLDIPHTYANTGGARKPPGPKFGENKLSWEFPWSGGKTEGVEKEKEEEGGK